MNSPVKRSMRRHSQGKVPVDGLQEVMRYLQSTECNPATIIETDGKAIVLDLSAQSRMFGKPLRGLSVNELGSLIDNAMRAAGTGYSFGRYGEDRELYNNENFAGGDSNESRTVHMGIDLFCVAGTRVCTPLDGEIVIVANNKLELDYGPMLVLKHRAGQSVFYSLYGHLNLNSISELREGQAVGAGDPLALLGSPPENGNWPPHLHFQLIVDLLGLGKDFPGVAFKSQCDFWLTLSPSPARFFPEASTAKLNANQ
ncbi:MAG: peptidoglycan DD-metalloendopeptidase family protein [Gammaproteobacteria bacterium]|nr:peptidoglycan DD-metalloendopeptidase family protein [Gammaproteobacteria bacterium]MDH4314127.1 peptidoglycan DD-metalloendopeptidase family protein [Gammaproteobacteria bacterium]MDH5212767.1 peptidoglycan DD-metalloendopeptidase family protein [Gammaproteobacteria bacterium]MDH5500473.1 peptidoglycan DD-metalloendopeptidase family protein [Gammaproteobacteria bacterium]